MLPEAFLSRPIAHRALHDGNVARAENQFAAIDAAIAAGFGIEIDIQPSRDGVPMVFHDYDLRRVTEASGAIATWSAADLSRVAYVTGERGVPTLEAVLDRVAGRVPLLVEIKDQDGALGPNVGRLETAVAALIARYTGPIVVMSFNPHSVAALAGLAPDVTRGLTTCSFTETEWSLVPSARRAQLAQIPDYSAVGASFVSHDWRDLASARVAELRDHGAAILCWTVRSPETEAAARRVAQNITFEGYLPA